VGARIAGYNSITLEPGSLQAEMEGVSRELGDMTGGKASCTEWNGCGLIVSTGVLSLAWFSVGLCSHGMSYYVPVLSGDTHLDMLMGAGIELGALLLAFVIIGGFGRRAPTSIFLGLCGIISVSIILVKHCLSDSSVNISSIVIGLSLLGRACVGASYLTLVLYTCEIFPTVIRTAALGSSAFFALAGSLLAPYLFLLGQMYHPDWKAMVAFITFGALCLLAAVLIFLLPETLDTNLPDTIKEAILLSVRARRKSGDSLDVGYGKCPEFVCVDGLIVSKDNALTEVESDMGTLRSRISSQIESDSSGDQPGYGHMSLSSSMMGCKKQKDKPESSDSELLSSDENLSSSSREKLVYKSVVSSMNSLVSTNGDWSVVSAENSMVYESDAKEEAIMELMRRKLLVMEGEETRL
jgi:hypothetical protein